MQLSYLNYKVNNIMKADLSLTSKPEKGNLKKS